MNQLLDRLSTIASLSDLETLVQLFLRSIKKGIVGYSLEDVHNIGRAIHVLLSFATSVFPNEALVETILADVVTALEPVLAQLSSEDATSLCSFFPAEVGLRLVQHDNPDHGLLFQAISQKAMELYSNPAIAKEARLSLEQKDTDQEAEDAYKILMDPVRLEEISVKTNQEFDRLVNAMLLPIIQKAKKDLDQQLKNIDQQLITQRAEYRESLSVALTIDQEVDEQGAKGKSRGKNANTPKTSESEETMDKKYTNVAKDKEANNALKKRLTRETPVKTFTAEIDIAEALVDESPQFVLEEEVNEVDQARVPENQREVAVVKEISEEALPSKLKESSVRYDQTKVIGEIRKRHKGGAAI